MAERGGLIKSYTKGARAIIIMGDFKDDVTKGKSRVNKVIGYLRLTSVNINTGRTFISGVRKSNIAFKKHSSSRS